MPSDPAIITGRLNVDDFVAARRSDIRKLEGLIANTGSNARKRAFQSLPRSERRRAASHDPKRVPRKKGLRKRAELENLRDNAKKLNRRTRPLPPLPQPKLADMQDEEVDISTIGSPCEFSKLSRPHLRYASRQRDKMWLPTHIWHRKRAFLSNIAGIMVPQTATQKQYRRTYRLTSHIDETGAIAWDSSFYSMIIVRHDRPLDKVFSTLFPGSTLPIYANGTKHWQGMLKQKGPVLIHWFEDNAAGIQCHPLIFNDLWQALLAASADVGIPDITLEDCRYAVGSIDIAGPWAVRILRELLIPTQFNTADSRSSWGSLVSSNIFPSRAVANLYVADPRLYGRPQSSASVLDTQINESLPAAGIYSKQCRAASIKLQQPQSVIDRLRSQESSDAPAANVPAFDRPQIPLTLFALDDGRFRILMPFNWVLPFWLMIFKRRHVLIGGQQELHQLAFEAGRPYFPHDFPYTPAGAAYNTAYGEERCAVYNRKPKSKRVSHSHELGDPFKLADLELFKDASPADFRHARIKALGRGVPESGARIFIHNTNLDSQAEAGRVRDLVLMSSKSNLIGFVTTGNFALGAAKGVGIGIVADSTSKTCIVRNPGSSVGFLASIETIEHFYSVL